MKNLNLLAAALTIALAGNAAAGPKAELPKELPPYAPERPLPVPQIDKATLANGLEVWIVPRSGLPRVDAVLAVRNAGLAADDAQHPGFATLLAGLLAEGTAKRDSRAIAETAQGLGGGIGAMANADGILLSGNALVSHAPDMIALLGEVARTPSFPENEVRLAQANALQGLKAAEAQPGFKAERALGQVIYGDHPYARTQPTEAAITSVTPQMLRAAHAQRFRPDRALLVLTGPISRADAMRAVEAAFGSWSASGEPLPDTPPAVRNAKPQRVLVQRDGSVQSAIRIGRPGIAATDADWAPLQLAGTVLGGGFSSRLMQNLREEKGYTYGASAGARMNRAGGAIVGGAEVRNDVTTAALNEYFSEYKRIGAEPVPAKEMEMNKRYLAGGYLLTNQLQRGVATTLANNWLVGLPAEFLGQYVPLIQKVTPEQVNAVSKKYFAPENQSIVVVGDAKAVGEQLKAFGEFTVTDK